MHFLDQDDELESLHDLAKTGSSERWALVISLAQNPEYAQSLKFSLNKRDELRYTPLHCAIFARNYASIEALAELGADVNLKCFGTPCLHLVLTAAALPDGRHFGMKAFDFLLPQVDLSAKDDQGATALHIAAELNLAEAVRKILENNAGAELIDSKDRTGLRPVHRAAANNAVDAIKALVAGGADPNLQSVNGSTPLHLAAAYGAAKAWSTLISVGAHANVVDKLGRSANDIAKLSGWNPQRSGELVHTSLVHDLSSSASSSSSAISALPSRITGVISHPICREHFTCPPSETESQSAPPENTKRIHVLIDAKHGALRSHELLPDLKWVSESRAAALADVLRVHEWPYICSIMKKCDGILRDPENPKGMSSLDGDTTLSRETFNASLHAAGAVCDGVDMVVKGDVRNVFCAIRPPGHHAGPKGIVKGEEGGPDSHGFCFLNNISIGAAYALHVHRENVKRVVIVDFDVHHGNGTEETVRWLVPSVEKQEWVTPAHEFGYMYKPVFKPWHDAGDAQNVLFVSVHGYGPREEGLEYLMPAAAFYPGTGKTVIPNIKPRKGRSSSTSSAGSGTAVVGAQKQKFKDIATSESESKMDAEDEDGGDDEGNNDEKVDADDDEDDDDSDDEDFDGQENNDDDDDDQESIPPPRRPGSGGKVQALMDLFQPKRFDGDSLLKPDLTAVSATLQESEPLILDVGVPLPSTVGALPPEATSATASEYRHQWRNYFREVIFPRLMTFQPDMIFISAGFDAHKKDTINAGYISLVEEDFEWITMNLVKIANSCCNGRVVSALEGGYQLGGEYCSAFAKSVKAHVAALAKMGKSSAKYSQADADKEKAVEREILDDAERRRLAKIESSQNQSQSHTHTHTHESGLLSSSAEKDILNALIGHSHSSDLASTSPSPSFPLVESVSVSASISSEVQDATSGEMGEGSSRKRRRAAVAVDYVALNEELKKSAGSGSHSHGH